MHATTERQGRGQKQKGRERVEGAHMYMPFPSMFCECEYCVGSNLSSEVGVVRDGSGGICIATQEQKLQVSLDNT